MKYSEVCRCGGSLTLEAEKGETFDITAAVDEWRTLHDGCERSPQYVDRSGSTTASAVFGFANPRPRGPVVCGDTPRSPEADKDA